jgi:integrase
MGKRLTDKYLKSLKPPASGRLAISDAAVEGLWLRITARGAQSWLVRCRVKGQKKQQKGAVLGPYPEIPLAKARRRAAEIVAAAKGGRDLIEEEKRQKEDADRARARARTVAEVSEDFLRASERLKSYRQRKSYIKNHILPAIGERVIGEIRRADVAELLDDVEHKRALGQTVNRVRETLLAFFEFAVERQLADANPVAGTKRRKVEIKRSRTLSPDELRTLWAGLASLPDPLPAFIKTLLLTGCRREEARGMRWAELDLDAKVWTIPGSRTKNGRNCEVPLSSAMVEVLTAVPRRGAFVFTRDSERPIAGMSDLKAAVDKASGLSGWRMHDLRRGVRTGLAQLGVAHEVAELTIGHTLPGLIQRYNCHSYADEKRAALQRWADHLQGIVKADPGKVVRLERKG